MRKGALGNIAAVSTAWSGNPIYKDTMKGIYTEGLTLGQSFSKSYIYDPSTFMTTLLGDPTFDLNPENLLEESTWQ